LRNSVFTFGGGTADGDGDMKEVLGGKGAGLAEMSRAGLPVPPGFTIATHVCNTYFDAGKRLPDAVQTEVARALAKLEKEMDQKLGDAKNPLLLSVRSGAKFSMPGMMNTILNLGLNDVTTAGLAKRSGNERFAYDCYRRFIQMFGEVALEIEMEKYDHIFDARKAKAKVKTDSDLTAEDLKAIIIDYKKLVQKETKKPFPEDPREQLNLSVGAVFGSWWNPKAAYYRKMEKIPDEIGTAANVQAMVFGNLGETSGTGVCFTRDPGNGVKDLYGEFLMNAQGEDVVAGIRTPIPIAELDAILPDAFDELKEVRQKLEDHFRDMQDFEFTIQEKKVYLLYTRNGRRTGPAAVRIAVEMVQENLISTDEALLRVSPIQISQHLSPTLSASSLATLPKLGNGISGSPGAAVGRLAFSSESAIEYSLSGPVILVRKEVTPDDIHGMDVSKGVVTTVGGKSSHASMMARGMGRPCVVGMGQLHIDERENDLWVDTRRGALRLRQGDWVSLDGTTGAVFAGAAKTVEADVSSGFVAQLLKWADERSLVKVRADADLPRDAKIARQFGAQGIGLCRTEFMFFEFDRLRILMELLLATDGVARQSALRKILPCQRSDFVGIFTAMDGYPVAIRLLDPLLNDLLPKREKLMVDVALLPYASLRKKKEIAADYYIPVRELKKSLPELLRRVETLSTANPKLGHRGCRFGVCYPEVTKAQARAIFEAAVLVSKRGVDVHPQVLIPMVDSVEEFENQKRIVVGVADEVLERASKKIRYSVGAAIETPRAALTADTLAKSAEFFAFGPGHLTQLTMGLSSDDYTRFLRDYEEAGIFKSDPFAVLDQEGVGKLMKIAIESSRGIRPSIGIGAFGSHCAEPGSLAFLQQIGVHYVSCSPFSVPMARLASAQSAIMAERARS